MRTYTYVNSLGWWHGNREFFWYTGRIRLKQKTTKRGIALSVKCWYMHQVNLLDRM